VRIYVQFISYDPQTRQQQIKPAICAKSDILQLPICMQVEQYVYILNMLLVDISKAF
jgi:hypothetical protein